MIIVGVELIIGKCAAMAVSVVNFCMASPRVAARYVASRCKLSSRMPRLGFLCFSPVRARTKVRHAIEGWGSFSDGGHGDL